MTNFNEVYDLAQAEANKLTAEMDAIFSPFKIENLEAPEFMPEADRNKWYSLYRTRKGIFDRMTRLEQVSATLDHYLKMEVL